MLRVPALSAISIVAVATLCSNSFNAAAFTPILTPTILSSLPNKRITSIDGSSRTGNPPQTYNTEKIKSHSRIIALSSTTEATEEKEETVKKSIPKLGNNGLYELVTKEDHLALVEANPDKIVIIKVYAPWCRACKGLAPKFVMVSKDKKYKELPLVFAEFSVQHNKDYVKSLGILALPSIMIYAGTEGLIENFPCSPSKVPILKKKIAQIVNAKVDSTTYELKPVVSNKEEETVPCIKRPIKGVGETTELSVGNVVVSQKTMDDLRNVCFFKDLTDEEFSSLMAKATYNTFEPGSVLMKQGKPGSQFYFLDSGEVEISVRGAYQDPLTTPDGYLGAVVNRLTKGNYFGERSLLTGQTRAASIRATDKSRCFVFKMEDIPASSSLSGKSNPSADRLAQVNEKYALDDYYNIDLMTKQNKDVNVATQIRGSVNKPESIDIEEEKAVGLVAKEDDGIILCLLLRFKLLRHASRCIDYIKKTAVTWGEQGEMNRRALLVSKLTQGQRDEFTQVFDMIDTSKDGKISFSELKNILETIDDNHTDEEITQMINKADLNDNGNDQEMTKAQFMGLMAEAEFYYLFQDTFQSLDRDGSGYVQAWKIDKVLCGLRDLISDDRMSVIDIEDKDLLIDYETFSRMMIGSL